MDALGNISNSIIIKVRLVQFQQSIIETTNFYKLVVFILIVFDEKHQLRFVINFGYVYLLYLRCKCTNYG